MNMNYVKKGLFAVIVMACSVGFAQHHIKGRKGVDVGLGLTKHGLYGYGDYNAVIDAKFLMKGGLIVESGKINTSNYTTILANVGGYYTPFTLGHKFYTNIGLGLIGKYDGINAFEGQTEETTISYGGFVGIDLEYYFTSQFGLHIDAKQAYYPGGKFDTQAYFTGLGIKYLF